jgi:hypothetical protein
LGKKEAKKVVEGDRERRGGGERDKIRTKDIGEEREESCKEREREGEKRTKETK